MGRLVALAIVFTLGVPAVARAQPGAVVATISAERAGDSYALAFFNRPIVVLRAKVAGRGPAERGIGAGRLLHELVADRTTSPVEARPFEGGAMILVASRGVLVLTTPDVDELAGETLEGVTAETVTRLRQALDEAAEAHAPAALLRGAVLAGTAGVLAVLVLWGLGRGRRRITTAIIGVAERKIAAIGVAPIDVVHSSRVLDVQRYLVTFMFAAIDLFVVYAASTFALRQFPYTRPWGESMRGFLITTLESLGLQAVRAMPGLFTVVVIIGFARLVIRLMAVWFTAVEQGQVHARWIHPDTAQPTRRLVTALLWLFAVIIAYPYMPGSQTEAFKSVSVFLGLMVTFGSSGLVNQIMSGFMIMYSRAVRVGDFVRIGDQEGTVTHLGVLSTKIKSLWNEDVTIPNAVVVAQTTTDYSRTGDTEGIFTPISVTIGYDAPWRQIHALLLTAAERTTGLRADPSPMVLQASLEDFYVKYTLLVSLECQHTRLLTLNTLHANIQDVFNEHGVQIMSPNYMLDPAAPKVVPKERWFEAPARPDPPGRVSSSEPGAARPKAGGPDPATHART